MNKITLLILITLTCTFSFSQEKHSRIKITNPDAATKRIIATGKRKKEAPFVKNPSLKRSKSSPPGFGGA